MLHANFKSVYFFAAIVWLVFSNNSFASCNLLRVEVLKPTNANSPRHALAAIGKEEVQVTWSVCNNTDEYVLHLKQADGKDTTYKLSEARKKTVTTNLLLPLGQTYTLTLDQIGVGDQMIDRVEQAFATSTPTSDPLELLTPRARKIATAGTSTTTTDGAGETKKFFEPFAGVGAVNYSSSKYNDAKVFSLPAVIAGFRTVRAEGFGFGCDVLKTLGSKQASSSITVTSYYNFTADLNYRFQIDKEWTVSPLISLSQQSINEINGTNKIVADSLSHMGLGARGDWSYKPWTIRGGIIFSPHFGSSGLGKITVEARTIYSIDSDLSLAMPLSYQRLGPSTLAFGQEETGILSAGLVLAYTL